MKADTRFEPKPEQEGPKKDQEANQPEGVVFKPEDFGYERFNKDEHTKDVKKQEEQKKQEAQLKAQEMKNILGEAEDQGPVKKEAEKLNAIKSLDKKIMLTDKDHGDSPRERKAKEKSAFVTTLETLTGVGTFEVKANDETHPVEFKGLTQCGKNLDAQQVKKIFEEMDQGAEAPKDIEFKFQASFNNPDSDKKDENINVSYLVNLHQIMRDGLETTLSSLLYLSYAAAAQNDKSDKEREELEKNKDGQPAREVKKQVNPEATFAQMTAIEKELTENNIATSSLQIGQQITLVVHIQEKTFTITHNSMVFQVDETSPQKTPNKKDKPNKISFQKPSEVVTYIESTSR